MICAIWEVRPIEANEEMWGVDLDMRRSRGKLPRSILSPRIFNVFWKITTPYLHAMYIIMGYQLITGPRPSDRQARQ